MGLLGSGPQSGDLRGAGGNYRGWGPWQRGGRTREGGRGEG